MNKHILLTLLSGVSVASAVAGIPVSHFQKELSKATVVYDRPLAGSMEQRVKIFNLPSEKGFVLTVNDQVVGYSDESSFSLESAPEAMVDMLNALSEASVTSALSENVGNVENSEIVADEENTTKTRYTPVAPLQSERGPIMWNQDSPFNDLCPLMDITNRCPSGCVATAMAQVMYYHQWPEKGVGEHTYAPVVLSGNTLSADFGNTTYQWDAMLPDYYSGYSAEGYTEEESRRAVAELMLHCGVAVDMVYYTQSGATDYDVPPALVEYFRYDPSMAYRKREHYSTNDWLDIINRELLEGRMILAYGRANSGGHAYVFDGMDSNGFIHVNWGWGGMSNGYFATSALTPASQGIGGSDGGFNYSQRIITGIKPAVEGVISDSHVELTSTEGITVGKKKIAMGSEVTVKISGKITNQGWQSSTFDYAMILLDAASLDTVCIIEGPQSVTLAKDETTYAPNFGKVTFPDLAEGDYILYPACRIADGNGSWIRIRDSYVGYPNYISVSSDGSSIYFNTPNYFELKATDTDVPQTIYASLPTLITTTVTNEGDVAYHGEVKAVLRSGSAIVASTTNYIIDLATGESTDIRFTDAFKAAAGQYTLALIDDDGRTISSQFEVQVMETPALGAVTSTELVSLENNSVYDMAIKANVKVEGGVFNGMLYAYIYSKDGRKQQGCLFPEYVALKDGQEAEVVMRGTFENGIPGTTYLIRLATYNGTSYTLLEDDNSYAHFVFLESTGINNIEVDVQKGKESDYIYFDLLGRPVDPRYTRTYKKLRIRK